MKTRWRQTSPIWPNQTSFFNLYRRLTTTRETHGYEHKTKSKYESAHGVLGIPLRYPRENILRKSKMRALIQTSPAHNIAIPLIRPGPCLHWYFWEWISHILPWGSLPLGAWITCPVTEWVLLMRSLFNLPVFSRSNFFLLNWNFFLDLNQLHFFNLMIHTRPFKNLPKSTQINRKKI